MELRQKNPRKQGDIGEGFAIAWLTQAGFDIWVPLGTNPNVDLIAERDGELHRVQVKTGTAWEKNRWAVRVCTSGGNQSWNRIIKHFSPTRCDYLFVLTGGWRCWFIPARAVEATTSVHLGGPKYAEFEVTLAAQTSETILTRQEPLPMGETGFEPVKAWPALYNRTPAGELRRW